MIPPFVDSGYLPAGVHPATVAEFEERFVRFDRSDRRIQVYRGLRQLLEELRNITFVKNIFVAGSFVTSKAEPNDFDCLVVVDAEKFPVELRPFEYRIVSRSQARKIFKGDVIIVAEGSKLHLSYLQFFQTSRNGDRVGIVEILL